MDLLSKDVIATFSNVLMTAIWLVYLHLFFVSHRRKLRPFFVIHHAQGQHPASLCLFVNMSEEPVHVQCVIAVIETDTGSRSRRYVTDYHRITPDDRNVQARLRQGPIQSGGYLTLGSFEDIIFGEPDGNDPCEDAQIRLGSIRSLRLCIAVIHGPSREPVGACRDFCIIEKDSSPRIRPVSTDTRQLISKGDKVEVREWIRASLEAETDR